MARTIPIDLDWMAHGYLVLPDGRLRHVIDLDRIARDIACADALLSWADLPGEHAAFCHVESRNILLAPWMYWVHPAFLRRVLTEELGHCVTGHCEERARDWQWCHYRDIILPAWAS